MIRNGINEFTWLFGRRRSPNAVHICLMLKVVVEEGEAMG